MTQVAFASCCKILYSKSMKVQPVWGEIEARQPDLLLLMGDNVYMRQNASRQWDFDSLRAAYQAQLNEAHFSSLLKKVPFMAVWDDHDFGPNDSRGASKRDRPHRDRSRRLFHRYMDKAINDNRPEVYCSYELGEVKFIMLDVRYYRTDLRSPRKATILGERQEEWLWNQLHHDRKYTVVGSGTSLDTEGKRDRWSAYQHAYHRLRSHLQAIPRLLFIAGDIHRNKFVQRQGFYEVISSGVGRTSNGQPLENYGLIDFGPQQVKIELRGRQQKTIKKTIRSSDWKLV